MIKFKDIKRGEIKPITYWEANLSNGKTARESGDNLNSWDELIKYTKKHSLRIIAIRIVVRSRFYHIPNFSKNYRFKSIIPKKLEYIPMDDRLGIKAEYEDYIIILWVDKKKGHCWVQIDE